MQPTHHHDHAGRAVGIVGLLGIGLIHLLDSIGKYGETRYIFWMYIALIVGTIVVSGWLLHRESRLSWLAAGVLGASAIAGFVLSRTTGLPNAKGDIGNWTEPLGLASLFVEGCLVALSAYKVATLGRVVVQVRRIDPRTERRPQRARQEIAAY